MMKQGLHKHLATVHPVQVFTWPVSGAYLDAVSESFGDFAHKQLFETMELNWKGRRVKLWLESLCTMPF